MCIQDLAMMLNTGSSMRQAAVGAAVTEVIGPDKYRVSLHISGTQTGVLWVGPRNDVAVGNGLIMNGFAPPLAFNIWDHGTMVQKAWFVFSVSGATNVGILETFMSPDWIEKAGLILPDRYK